MHTVQQGHWRITQGEDMSKEDALKLIKLLSAMESWAFSTKTLLPDYLHEDLTLAVEKLEKVVLAKPAGLDGLEDMSKMNKRPLKELE
jgi:hypothetical protein